MLNQSIDSQRWMLFVLAPAFALTAVADTIHGPMMPTIATAFRLGDAGSAAFLFWAFVGMSCGALLCRGNYVRIMVAGFALQGIAFLSLPWMPSALLLPAVFLAGLGTGAPMTAISLFLGRNFPQKRAARLTLFNLFWSVGALSAPLLAARLLTLANWKLVYLAIGTLALAFAVVLALSLRDSEEQPRLNAENAGLRNLRLIAIYALFFFLEVGIESALGAWTTSYLLRAAHLSVASSAAATSLYWTGFLLLRLVTPLLLRRLTPVQLLQASLGAGMLALLILISAQNALLLLTAVLLLGCTFAPINPLALALFLDRARQSSDSRFVLSLSGFGGAVLPWMIGQIAACSHSLRTGLLVAPGAMIALLLLMPFMHFGAPAPTNKS